MLFNSYTYLWLNIILFQIWYAGEYSATFPPALNCSLCRMLSCTNRLFSVPLIYWSVPALIEHSTDTTPKHLTHWASPLPSPPLLSSFFKLGCTTPCIFVYILNSLSCVTPAKYSWDSEWGCTQPGSQHTDKWPVCILKLPFYKHSVSLRFSIMSFSKVIEYSS